MEVIQPKAGRYLSFLLNGRYYASQLGAVREIRQLGDFESVEQAPEYVLGKMNLPNGEVMVVDLKHKLALGPSKQDRDTCVLVINNGEGNIGLLVDAVSEVVSFTEASLIPQTRKEDSDGASAFTQGLGKMNEKLMILLDLPKAVSGLSLNDQGQFNLNEAS